MRTVTLRQESDHEESVFQLMWYSPFTCSGPPTVCSADGPTEVMARVAQSTGCESMAVTAPVTANFTGTVDPAFAELTAGAFPTGARKPAKVEAVHDAGSVKSATPSSRLLPSPWDAAAPRPRLANARQISHWFAPLPSAPVPVRASSARRIALRPSTKPGRQGWNFMPSMTSWMVRLLPPVSHLPYRLELKPYLSTRFQYISHNIVFHT